MSGRSNRPIQGHHDGESDELEDQSRRLAASVETSPGRHPAQSTDDDSTHPPHRGKKSRSKKHIERSRESDDSDSDSDVAPSPPRRGRKSRSKRRIKRPHDSDDEEDDEGVDLGRVEKIVDDERVNIQKTMQSIASWMEVNRPPVTAERFRELAPIPTQDADYTQEDFNNVLREWNEDPMRNLILGRHTAANVTLPGAVPPKEPRRGERESFASLYRIFPRHYGCLYEEFMGPTYRLTYDNSENRHVYLEDGSMIPDPFPSKGFSENLKQIVLHDIWRGKLAVIAACLQYVNMLRTNDRRPWQLPDGVSESHFFRTWNDVIQDRRGSGERVDSLYGRVKTVTGSDPGLYGDFFDQMTESFRIKAKPQSDNVSKRTKDDDPYFIRTTDLTILLHAIDNYGYGGTTHYHRAQRVAVLKHWSKTGNDYPSVKQFGEARDLSILSTRLLARKEENRKARLATSQAADPRLQSSSSMSSSALPPPRPIDRDREAEYKPASHDDEGQYGDAGNPSSADNQTASRNGANPSSAMAHPHRDEEDGDTPMGGVKNLSPAAAEALSQSRWSGASGENQNARQTPSLPQRRDQHRGKGPNHPGAKPTGLPNRRSQHATERPGRQILDLTPRPSPREAQAMSRPPPPVNWNTNSIAQLSCRTGEVSLVDEKGKPIKNEVRKLNATSLGADVTGSQTLGQTFNSLNTLAAMQSEDQEYTLLLSLNRSSKQRRMDAIGRNDRGLYSPGYNQEAASDDADVPPANRRRNNPSRPQVNPFRPNPSRPQAQLTPFVRVCGNCGGTGHVLGQCVTIWSEAGDINVCYRCNKVDHIIDDCPMMPRITDYTRYQCEVISRAGRPPLRSRRGWDELAVANNYEGQGPISRQTMIMVSQTQFANWKYDVPAENQQDLLVMDVQTKGKEAIGKLESQAYARPSHPNDMRGQNKIDN